jgi:hypothetical protein
MTPFKISILNRSTVLTDSAVAAAVPDLQTQISRDFGPAWGLDATLSFTPRNKSAPKGTRQLIILDNSEQAGALGYHDITEDGLPLGKIFAKTDITYGNSWTVATSHELLEMLADPDINLCVYVTVDGKPLFYAYEIGDPCEADQYGYKIGKTLVSNFVFPSWFEPLSPKGTQFDFQKKIKQPLGLLPGGYLQYFDITTGTGWQQKTEPLAKGKKMQFPIADRAHVGSRRERRQVDRQRWLRSAPRKNAFAFNTAATNPQIDAVFNACVMSDHGTANDADAIQDAGALANCLNQGLDDIYACHPPFNRLDFDAKDVGMCRTTMHNEINAYCS